MLYVKELDFILDIFYRVTSLRITQIYLKLDSLAMSRHMKHTFSFFFLALSSWYLWQSPHIRVPHFRQWCWNTIQHAGTILNALNWKCQFKNRFCLWFHFSESSYWKVSAKSRNQPWKTLPNGLTKTLNNYNIIKCYALGVNLTYSSVDGCELGLVAHRTDGAVLIRGPHRSRRSHLLRFYHIWNKSNNPQTQ